MSILTHRGEFAATPEALWDLITDPARLPEWMSGVEECQYTAGDPGRPGSTFIMKIREGRKLSHYDGKVLEAEPPRRLVLETIGGCGKDPAPMRVEYRLSDSGGGTRLDYSCRFEIKGFWRILTPLGLVMGKLFLRRFYKNLARLAEPPPSVPVTG